MLLVDKQNKRYRWHSNMPELDGIDLIRQLSMTHPGSGAQGAASLRRGKRRIETAQSVIETNYPT